MNTQKHICNPFKKRTKKFDVVDFADKISKDIAQHFKYIDMVHYKCYYEINYYRLSIKSDPTFFVRKKKLLNSVG